MYIKYYIVIVGESIRHQVASAMFCMTQMPTVTQQPTTGPHSLYPRVVAECIQPPLPAHEEPGQNTSRFSGINGSTARAKVYDR